MNYDDANTLRDQIIQGLQPHTRRIVTPPSGNWDQFHNDIVVNVGQDWFSLELRGKPCVIRDNPFPAYEKFTLRVRTQNTKPKLFKERKNGWFNIDQIVDHILGCLENEEFARLKLAEIQRKIRTADNIIKRLEKLGVPDNVFLVSSENGVTVRVEGASEEVAAKVLNMLRGLTGEKPETEKRGLWDHLQDDDQTEPEVSGDI